MEKKIFQVAVVGCGAISDIYIKNMQERFEQLNVVSCCAAHYEHAEKKAAQYDLKPATYAEILADQTIDIVVILTPAPTHFSLIRQALEAGKHVYSEKTLTISDKDAWELYGLAEEKGCVLGAAPDTFLGAAWQNARKAVDDGMLGEITGFQISANRDLDLLVQISPYLRMPGGGLAYDYGVYYLTALVSLLGPVKEVYAKFLHREGYENESQVNAVIELQSGVQGNFALNGNSVSMDQAVFWIYGTKGILKLSDPNQFGGEVVFIENRKERWQEHVEHVVDYGFAYGDNSRGLGVAEMADAIAHGRCSRANKELACHVLETICRMEQSSACGLPQQISSVCERPAAMFAQ